VNGKTQDTYQLKFFGNSVINSYSQMFFSDNKIFAWLILLASFVNPYVGLSGLLAVCISIFFAQWLGFNRSLTHSGAFSFNSLTIGLVMGLYFNYSIAFFILLIVCCFMCVVFTKAIIVVLTKYELPVLSLPFVFTVWMLLLSTKDFSAIHLTERGIYTYNELFSVGGLSLVNAYDSVNELHFPVIVQAYFKSLGAIYFQYNIIAGILIAIGLLIYSRIAFTLSIVGFVTGFYFFYFFNEDLAHFTYGYIGFNYILAAISLGGYYIIPSRKSYLLAIAAATAIAILHSALGYLFIKLQLPLFSLPSSMVIIIILLTLKNRQEVKGLQLVTIQKYSPEKNLYNHALRSERFKNDTYFHIHLPFYGEWYISQGHDGGITHLDDWKYAWDFVVTDEMKKTFRLPGMQLTDYYCYNVPVVAPAYGYVYDIVDGIADNPVGGVDVNHNWGNTIIIKHADHFYSKISHIKEGSFKVKIGDYVKKGDIIANCGNSGRSPEPHIHFQLQTTPFIDSKTLKYPISYYIIRNYKTYEFHSFDYPLEQSAIMGVSTTPLIVNAFKFIPGEIFSFEFTRTKGSISKTLIEKWEVFTDAWNNSYLYCAATNSSAYFVNNGTLHYFTDFFGDKESLLYYFYLAARYFCNS